MFRRIYVIEQVRVGDEERFTLQIAGPREKGLRRWVFRSSDTLLQTLRRFLESPPGMIPDAPDPVDSVDLEEL